MSTPAFGRPKGLPLRVDEQRQVQLAVVPGIAQLVRRDGDGREGRGRLRLEEAEALRQLRRNEVAQGDVVDEHDEADGRRAPPRGVAPIGTSPVIDRDLGLEVDAVRLVGRGIGSRGPRKESEPPWYMSGSVQKISGISAPRALRTSST